MKTNTLRQLVIAATALGATQLSSFATNGTWDGRPGNWNVSGNWQDGIIGDGAGSEISLRTTTGALSLSLTDQRTVGSLLWNTNPTVGAITISGGGTLVFDGNGARPLIDLRSSAVGAFGGIESNVAGSNGVSVVGRSYGQYFLWNPLINSLTGGISISNVAFSVNDPSKLGSNQITFNTNTTATQNGAALRITSTTASTALANQLILASTMGKDSLVFGRSSVALSEVLVTGSISESGGRHDLSYQSSTGNTGGGRFIVSGNNSYTGDTNIGGSDYHGAPGSVIVRASSDNALGSGMATVRIAATHNALELSGGRTIVGKTMILNGRGYETKGSLNSVDGNNAWEGAIELGGTADATIGVAGDRLRITGDISGSSAGGLTKVGAGALELTGNNTYSTGTTIKEGKMIAGSNNALGSGTVALEGGELHVATGVKLELQGLELTSPSLLSFSLDDDFTATRITVDGPQIGAGIYDVAIDGTGMIEGVYTLLTITDTSQAAGFNLLSMPLGVDGSLVWEQGVLSFMVVPEPSTTMLLGVVLSGAALLRLRRMRRK